MTDKRKTTIRRLAQPKTPAGLRAYRSCRNTPLTLEERRRLSVISSIAIDAINIDAPRKGTLVMVVNAGRPDEVVFGTSDLKWGAFINAIVHEARRALAHNKYLPEADDPRCHFCGIGNGLPQEELVQKVRAVIAQQERQESKTRKMIDEAVKRKRGRDGKDKA